MAVKHMIKRREWQHGCYSIVVKAVVDGSGTVYDYDWYWKPDAVVGGHGTRPAS